MSKGINIWSLTPDLIISLLSDWQMTAVAAWDSEVICLHSKEEDWGLYWWEKLECKNSFLYSNVNEGFTLSCRFMFHVLDFRCWILLSQPCELLSSLSLSFAFNYRSMSMTFRPCFRHHSNFRPALSLSLSLPLLSESPAQPRPVAPLQSH